MRTYDVVIVGAGHAGAQLAIALLQMGFAGPVALIGDEAHPPYERPPLSKEFLAGDKGFERILIRPEAFWAGKDIDWIGSTRIVAIDPDERYVATADGERIGYARLVWATGGAARTLSLPGASADNVHVVRQRNDVDAIMAALPATRRVTVIGGGYIGLEAAAVLRKLDRKVTLLEANTRVLARVAGEALSHFYEAEHRHRGVDLRLGAQIASLNVEGELVTSVSLSTRERIATDMVIVGIGIVPEVEPLRSAGAAVADGVRVDALCRTTLPDVYAIGDCAAHLSRFANGREIRLESVQNANDQARTVAAHMTGREEPYDTLPWFWSNQYDLKLQTVGLSADHDETIVRGDPDTRSFSVLYLLDGRLIAVDAVNAVKDYVQAKPLIAAGIRPDRTALGDAAIPLKSLMPPVA